MSRGKSFILRNGRGKKRRYNGETAELVVPDGSASGGTGGPRPGGWVTVKIRRAGGGDDSGEGEIVKWRSQTWDLVNTNGSSPAAASCAGQQRDASTNTDVVGTSHESPTFASKSTEAKAEELASAMLGVLTSQGVLILPPNNGGSAVTLSTLKLKLKDTAVRVLRREHENPDACLERMPRDVWTKIFGFFVDKRTNISTVQEEASWFARRLFEGNIENAQVENEINRERTQMAQITVSPHQRALSFPNTCRIIRRFSTVSKIFGEEVAAYIKESLIEADFVAVKRSDALCCALWLMRHNAKLLTFRIRAESRDLGILSTLIEHCNTAMLKSFEAKLDRRHSDGGMVKRAWYSMQDCGAIIDVSGEGNRRRNTSEMLADMNVSADMKENIARSVSESEFYTTVSHCFQTSKY